MDDHQRSVPIGHKFVRRESIVADSLRQIAPWRTTLLDATEGNTVTCRTNRSLRSADARVNDALMQTTIVKVREPHLLRCHIHMLLIEYSRMGNESIKCISVSTTEIIDRITTIAGAAGSHFPNIRLCLELPGCSQIILHVQAGIVT